MSSKQKQPKGSAFSLPKIIFCMVGFILMVQNPLWVNLIILFCTVMFLLPLGLGKRLNGLIQSKVLLIKLQGLINQWYVKNVPEDEKADSTVIPTKQHLTSEEIYLEHDADFSTIPEPPVDQDSYDDVWANYDNNEDK